MKLKKIGAIILAAMMMLTACGGRESTAGGQNNTVRPDSTVSQENAAGPESAANQENAAFPSGLCAERSAIFAAQSNRPDQAITTLAIAARNSNGLMENPISPCGGCRQVVLEIEDRYQQPVRILLYGTRGTLCISSIRDLMPLSFVHENMH